ncbi:head-tail connector protein [Solibacillus cecembensis]|uniref:head-tail connector protein n=1 Tax=Solibacillus cecembensis TaxID=459347 RepID=UPI003D006389
MNILLDDLKDYLRIDGDDENSSLSLFLQSAILYLANAGVKQPSDYYHKSVEGNDVFSQHRLAVHMLATHYYENRIVYSAGKSGEVIPYGLQTIILQLKWVNPDELSTQ